MTRDAAELIGLYLDEMLTADEMAELGTWIQATPENSKRLADAVLLHDRLRNELRAQTALEGAAGLPVVARRPRRSLLRWIGLSLSLACVGLLFWRGLGGTPASAAVGELNRLIAASAGDLARTYRITVEAVSEPPPRKGPPLAELGRPPKPPMDGAVLHVRGGHQFVLIRYTEAGDRFITGCNGKTSWAVRPDGAARVSHDLTRFNRDVPGHEHAMPLDDLQACLISLRDAYEISVSDASRQEGELRHLIATRGRKQRGPDRVELTYIPATGEIREIRFVGMPYGPEKLTLQMALQPAADLDPDFFNHTAHHSSDRQVIEE